MLQYSGHIPISKILSDNVIPLLHLTSYVGVIGKSLIKSKKQCNIGVIFRLEIWFKMSLDVWRRHCTVASYVLGAGVQGVG